MADEHRAWEPMSEEQERRRIQNRLAQETFRRRMENNRVYQQGDPKPLRPAYTHEVYAPPPPQSSAWTSWDHRSVVSQPHHQDLSASRSECRSSRAAPVSTQLQVNMPAPAPDEDPHEMQGVLAPYEYRRVHGSIDETAVRTGPALSYEVQSALGTLSYRSKFEQPAEKVQQSVAHRSSAGATSIVSPANVVHFKIERGIALPPKGGEPKVQSFESQSPVEDLKSIHSTVHSPGVWTPYSSLEARGSIRLLELQPGQSDDPLTCFLVTTELESIQTPWEALSYCWGSTVRESQIGCRDKESDAIEPIHITTNLGLALRRLRRTNTTRTLWVDATCINQDDADERSEQVQQMGTIFASAARVLVWLGEEEQPGRAAQTLQLFRTVAYRLTNAVSTTDVSAEEWIPSSTDEITQWSKEQWQLIAGFYELGWFWRLWIIQEIVLAKEATILWADQQIPWDEVSLATSWIRSYGRPHLSHLPMPGVFNAYLVLSLKGGPSGPVRLSLLRLLSVTRQFAATDPRDRVYSVLGIQKSGSAIVQLRPDYNKPYYEVYYQVARAIVERSGSLHLLSCVQHGTKVDAGTRYSWVPQWHRANTHTLTIFDRYQEPEIGSSQSLDHRIDITHDGILRVHGAEIDVVKSVTEPFTKGELDSDTSSALLRRFARIVDSLSQASTDAYTAPYGSYSRGTDESPGILEAFSWTVIAGGEFLEYIAGNADGERREFLSELKLWIKSIRGWRSDSVKDHTLPAANLLATWPALPRFYDAVVSACLGRRLYTSSKGYIGLGPEALQPGDKICVISGALVPLILRQASDSEQWLLVGETYVDGLLDANATTGWRSNALAQKRAMQDLNYLLSQRSTTSGDSRESTGSSPGPAASGTHIKNARNRLASLKSRSKKRTLSLEPHDVFQRLAGPAPQAQKTLDHPIEHGHLEGMMRFDIR